MVDDNSLPKKDETPKVLDLNVKSLMGDKVYKINVFDNTSVLALKLAIQRKHRINLTSQTLVHGNVILTDDKKLSTYNLENDATLLLLPQMRCGPIDFRVNTQELQKFVRSVDADVVQLKKRLENMSAEGNGGPLNKRDFVMLSVQKSGTYRVTLFSTGGSLGTAPAAKNSAERKEKVNDEVDLETLQASNEKTRQKMAELRRKMQESEEKRSKRRLSKLAEAVAVKNDHTMSVDFVDAEAIVDEDDWNKLVKLMTEKRSETAVIEIPNALFDIVVSPPAIFGVESTPSTVAADGKMSHVIANEEEEEEAGSSKSSEMEDFFDCQEIENDTTLWKCFVDWLYLAIFHYKLKYFSSTAGSGNDGGASMASANAPTKKTPRPTVAKIPNRRRRNNK